MHHIAKYVFSVNCPDSVFNLIKYFYTVNHYRSVNVTINLLFSSINYNVNKHVLIFTNGHLYSSKILCSRPAAGRIYKHFIFIPAGAVPVYKFNFINSIFWTVSIQIFAIFSWAWLIPPHHCMWTILNFKSEFWLQLLGVSIVQLKTGFVILYHMISN